MSTEANYLRDLGYMIRQEALEARESHRTARGAQEREHAAGRLLAYHRVVSLMQNQAFAFQLPLESLCLDDIDPDRELVPVRHVD